jgi:flagellar biosynthesis protein
MAGKTFYNSNIAVALQYDGKNAPKVTAKGEGLTAQHILEIAEAHNIPLQNEPELARILTYVPLGEEIPQQLYIAVAEVIAFAYLISGKTPQSNHDV